MTQDAKLLLTASSTVTGGRSGEAHIGRDRLHVKLRPGRTRQEGTDPEELFAAGYASCFLSALNEVADARGLKLEPPQAKGLVSLHMGSQKDFFLSVVLQVYVPGVDQATAQDLVNAAHAVCPYSRAVQGNVDVRLEVLDAPVE
ncbi:Ohr family peroxiredoxin [Deinococcus hohokamensis]|uniref:Ohr family peroxiredoxin n=1 Tax=Deinococcus hohokamensis TaxID=309883 RepID=A0ABV9I8H8_9DEIO